MKVILILGITLTLAVGVAGQSADAADTSAAAANESARAADGAVKLKIATDPPEAAVKIDGVDYGVTPIEIIGLEPGERSIELVKAGYFRRRATVLLDSAGADLNFELTRPASINITSAPAGAAVSVNGEDIGLAPAQKGALRPGEYKISAAYDGYEQADTMIVLASGDTASAHLVLKPSSKPETLADTTLDITDAVTKDPTAVIENEAVSSGTKKKKTWITEAVLITFFVFIAVVAGIELSSY